MNEILFHWLNGWNARHEPLDALLRFVLLGGIKGLPYALAIWSLWFWSSQPDQRQKIRTHLTATIFLTVPVIAITRAIANFSPMQLRPLHTPDLAIRLQDEQETSMLDGFSSMPSDHASVYLALTVCVFLIHRPIGMVLLVWSIFFVCLPRIVYGLHWPADILAGAALGCILAVVLLRPFAYLVESTGFLAFMEKREALAYPLLFLATHEISTLFNVTRYVVLGIMD